MAIITVKASGGTFNLTQLQAAIDAAVDGDTITIQAGQQCTQSVVILRNKGTLTAGITITTDAASSSLPAAGVRTGPAYAAFMPIIKSAGGGDPAMKTAPGANGYTLRHIWFANVPFGFENILNIGANDSTQTFLSQQPFNITVDRCVFMGGTVCGQKRAMIAHGANLTISNNYCDNIFSFGVDSQSLACVNGTGPVSITNNWFRGGTYSFIAGGADAQIRTFLNITGTPTTTSADVTCSEAGHVLAELSVGQGIGLAMVGITGGWQWTTIRSITGSGTSGTITFDAIATAPTVGTNNAKTGVILNGLTFQKNHCGNNPAWFDRGAIDTPLNFTATAGAGSLAAGTYFYSVQAQHTAETYEANTANGFSVRTAELSRTLGAPGSVALACDAVTNANLYFWYRGTVAGSPTSFKTTATPTLTDDGTFGWLALAGAPNAKSSKQFKNIFELKACQNAQIDSNIFEYVRQGVDIGFCLWLKTVNQDGNGVWNQSKNVVVEKNIFRHCFGWLEIHGRERGTGTFGYPGTFDTLTIRNNLVYDSGPQNSNSGTSDQYAMFMSAVKNLTFDHNTVIHTTTGSGGGACAFDSSDVLLSGFVYQNNLIRKETFGFHDSNGLGNDGAAVTAATVAPATFVKNAIADGGGAYPGQFTEVAALWQAEFITYAADGVGADFHLKSSSAYHLAGTDLKDLGADIDAVLTATASVMTGVPGSPSPSPPDAPSSPNPADTQTGVSTSPTLQWSSASALSWDVYFGTASNPPLVASSVSAASYTPAPLANNTVYFWKIIARNDAGTTTGPIWSFTTIPVASGPAHHRHGRFHR